MPAYFRRLAQRAGIPGESRPAGRSASVPSGLRPSAPVPMAPSDVPTPALPADLAVSATVEAAPARVEPLLRASPAALGLAGPDAAATASVADPASPAPTLPPAAAEPEVEGFVPGPSPLEAPPASFVPLPTGPSRSASDAPAPPADRYMPVTPARPPGPEAAEAAVEPGTVAVAESLGRPRTSALELDLEMPAAGAATVALRTAPRRPWEEPDAWGEGRQGRTKGEAGPSLRETALSREAFPAPSPRPVHVHIGSVSLEIRQTAAAPRPQVQTAQPRPRPAAPAGPAVSTPSAGGFRPSRHYLRG